MRFVESVEIHDELNPKIWDEKNNLIKEVGEKVTEIASEFIRFTEMPIRLVDIHILGSNASYNYTDHSDLDIHLIVNFDLIDDSDELVQILFNSLKSRFNEQYDISIRGLNAEIYVEDIKANTVSNGIYSVFKKKWIKFPIKLPKIDPDLQSLVDETVSELSSEIARVLMNPNVDKLSDLIDEIYLMRKEALSTSGEFGLGNLVFKELRNRGEIEKINNKIINLKSKELSLESIIRKILKKGN